MHYFIGDPQGCDAALGRLLDELGFSPSRDHLHVLGDLVNRGPQSLAVLRRLRALGHAATCLLGNHDLHFLAVAAKVRKPSRQDTLDELLRPPERDVWVQWLRQRPLADMACGWLVVHAGVVPQWSTAQTLALAQDVETLLQGPGWGDFMVQMYGNEPARWSPDLRGVARWRFIINTLTRIRFCKSDGTLELTAKDGAHAAPEGFKPWFDHIDAAWRGHPIAFGHWSTLGLINRPDLLALDTGCVWGGALTAVRVDGGRRDIFQIRCPQAQRPDQP